VFRSWLATGFSVECYWTVFAPMILAVGGRLISDTVQYELICINQTWSSVYAGLYAVALLFRCRYRRMATAVITWLSKPVLLLFALQFYTLGIGINHYVIAVDSLPTLVVIATSLAAVGYLSAFRNKFIVCRRLRCFGERDVVVVGPNMAPSGADLAASNCLLALAVLRLALDQPEADLASAIPLWLLILHPLPLLWYWLEANVRRYMKKHGHVGLGWRNASGQRHQFGFARKLLSVSLTAGTSRTKSFDDIQLQIVERVTVV